MENSTVEVNDTISNDQRGQWNSFLDYAKTQDDNSDVNGLLSKYKGSNPDFSITPEMLSKIRSENDQFRNGDNFAGLNADQLNTARTGMSQNFLKQTDLLKSYYPQFKVGSQDFGTDIEGYANSKVGLAPIESEKSSISASAPTSAPDISVNPPSSTSKTNIIQQPDYNNQASRNKFLQNWEKQYGNLEGRGDTVLRVNDVPRGGSDTMKNIATTASKKYGIDPALLYSSAMEEGASGLFKNLNGTDTKGRKPGSFGYQDYYGDKEFPINGGQNFGFQTFAERFPELVKGGYLSKDFANQFRGVKAALVDDAEYADANNFKTVDAAMQAKAAMMKQGYDEVDQYAKSKGVTLTPKQRDFFALAQYNGGEGGFQKVFKRLNAAGLLKDDTFLDKRPESEKGIADNLDIWGHVVRRMAMARNLKEQQLF